MGDGSLRSKGDWGLRELIVPMLTGEMVDDLDGDTTIEDV